MLKFNSSGVKPFLHVEDLHPLHKILHMGLEALMSSYYSLPRISIKDREKKMFECVGIIDAC